MSSREHAVYWQHAAPAPASDAPHDQLDVPFTSLALGSTSGVVGPVSLLGSVQESAYVPNTASTEHRRPRFSSQSSIVADPILTGGQQYKGVEKLRREVYNPQVQRPSLYYRDYNSTPNSREKRNDEDGKKCAVCLDDFDPRETVTLTPCNHMFHEKCIVPWVKSHGQCPVCRFVIGDRTRESQGAGSGDNNEYLGNDPFARELISFIRGMEGRGSSAWAEADLISHRILR